MADKIIVEDLVVHGRHGWRRFQESYPQPFKVNAMLELDLEPVAQSDDLNDTIDYALVCEQIKEIVDKESFAMIEKLAHTIAMRLLDMGALKVRVRVAKPGVALIHGAGSVAIEIERERIPDPS